LAERQVAITMGDPSGIGPEICALALTQWRRPDVVVGNLGRLEEAAGLLVEAGRLNPGALRFRAVDSVAGARGEAGVVDVLDLANVPASLPWGRLSEDAGRAGYEYLERATQLALAGEVGAVCTAPINKEAWRLAGVPYLGHTEALAALCGVDDFAMMLVNQGLRVIHLSTHSSLREAIRLATAERCLACVRLADGFLRTRLRIARPRIAVAGINPHAGEHGLLGDEDRDQLLPAVRLARSDGLDASGPWPPDTVYARAAQGEFDVVVAAFHDQGHIPIKMIGLDTGVNVTVGLPVARTSVDHGTAFDIAGTGRARAANLLAALELAHELAGTPRA